MRIGIDARLWNQTGVGRYIRNLVYNLEKIDKKNDYVLFVREKDLEQLKIQKRSFLRNPKFKIVRANISWHSLEEQLKFPKILNRENLDLVHFPYISIPFSYRRPYVLTIHDLIPYHYPTGKASILPLPLYGLKLLSYKFLVYFITNRALKIITVSQATKKEIIDHLKISSNKIVVTHEGTDLKPGIGRDKSRMPFFLYVGNAYPHKNLEKLLEVFSKLKKLRTDANLVFVGKDDYFYRRLKKFADKLGILDSVVFLGDVSDARLAVLYRSAAAFISTSLMEGFGLPVLEAMALSCPVIVSDIPTFREICKDAALYFNPDKEEEILERMKEVLYFDFNRKMYIKRGLEKAKEFSWAKTAQETLKIYKQSLRSDELEQSLKKSL